MSLTKEQYLKAYELMLLVRRFEEKCGQLYGMGHIGGFCHLYIGQEAIIGTLSLLKKANDSMITGYRDHGHIIMCGSDIKTIFAELMGKASGCSKGKGGSMHMFDVQNKFYGGHGIVGAQVPIGTGLAFAEKYRDSDGISYTFFGDGASNQGQVFEAFNMASIWKLPVIYIIENNRYGMGTSVNRSSAVSELHKKAISFNIKHSCVDGMDFNLLYKELKEATDYVRSGNGPYVLEVQTYRYRGHSMSDPAKYRTKDEVEHYKKLDPIENLKLFLLQNKYINDTQINRIESSIKVKIQEAIDFCMQDGLPSTDELLMDVYCLSFKN